MSLSTAVKKKKGGVLFCFFSNVLKTFFMVDV